MKNSNLTHKQRMRGTQGSHLWSCNVLVTLWLIDWIGLGVDLHMHMYCTGCTFISCWAWPWAWDWAPLLRNCCGQCCCTSPLNDTIYCSHNNTLVKIPNPGNSRYIDYFLVYRLRWQPCSQGGWTSHRETCPLKGRLGLSQGGGASHKEARPLTGRHGLSH
mgnify:CR=1 FL=1